MITKHLIESYEITEFVVNGACDTEEFIDVIKSTYPTITKNVLWNHSAGDHSNLTKNDFTRITAVTKEIAIHDKTAFLGDSDLIYGTLRMFETYAELDSVPLKMKAFRDREKAIDWLRGLNNDRSN